MNAPSPKLSREAIRQILIDFGRQGALRAGASPEEIDVIWQELFGDRR